MDLPMEDLILFRKKTKICFLPKETITKEEQTHTFKSVGYCNIFFYFEDEFRLERLKKKTE